MAIRKSETRHTMIASKENTPLATFALIIGLFSIAQVSEGQPALTSVVAWGNNYKGQTVIPAGLTNVTIVAAGDAHSFALKSDGTLAAWGWNGDGQSTVPQGLTNVVAVAGGDYHSLALRSDGTVAAWGNNNCRQTNVPPGLSNVVQVAAGLLHCVALRNDGTVVVWGDSSYNQTHVPSDLTNVVAIAAGGFHTLALKGDGTVVGWGANGSSQATAPPGLSNVVAIAGGGYHSLALTGDGTVVAWGYDAYGETDVPLGATNVVAISGGGLHSIALKADRTVVAWGAGANTSVYTDAEWGQSMVPAELTNVAAIAGGYGHSLALFNNGSPVIVGQPVGQTLFPGPSAILYAKAFGLLPLSYQWQFNGTNLPGATQACLTLTPVRLADSGNYAVVVTNNSGSVISSTATLAVLRPTPQFDTFGSNLRFTNNSLHLQLKGLSGHGQILVYASTNLANWQPILTNPPIIGVLQFVDSATTNMPKRFYRAEEK
jgi:hypothetical protein